MLDTESKGLGNYLQQISLVSDADEEDPNADTVKLMSIHAAKGLEFSCVFAAGLEEMLFPNAMAINTREELEEERPGRAREGNAQLPVLLVTIRALARIQSFIFKR